MEIRRLSRRMTCRERVRGDELSPLDEVAGFRRGVQEPVGTAVEGEILARGTIENPWFAVLQEILSEPEEFIRIYTAHFQAVEQRKVPRGRGI